MPRKKWKTEKNNMEENTVIDQYASKKDADGRYLNLDNVQMAGFMEFIRGERKSDGDSIPPHPPRSEVPPTSSYQPNIVEPNLKLIQENEDKWLVSWVGHSTMLVQLNGINIITDPIFSDRCSPVKFFGPKRTCPPGIAIENLPRIDIVLISHNHYDHCDLETIKRIGDKARYMVPSGMGDLIRDVFDRDSVEVTEMDWWEKVEVSNILGTAKCTVVAVPAQHFSNRGLLDRFKTLYCGFVVQEDSGNFYFAGDTGFGKFFEEIRNRLGKMRLATIPIGAYRPRNFMSPVHIDPVEAVYIHKQLECVKSIGMHWGTFHLGYESMCEPPILLKDTLQDEKLTDDCFVCLAFGETKEV